MDLDRWHRLMQRWSAPQCDDVHADLESAYAEPHRHYHTGQHIADCLEQIDRAVDLATAPEEVELGAGALSGDTAVVVDVDLSILGREPAEYDIYERAIREEYKWVPGPIYRRKRAEILESFLARPAIYETRHFVDAYEQSARENLRRAIETLRA